MIARYTVFFLITPFLVINFNPQTALGGRSSGTRTVLYFPSGGKQIRTDLYAPSGDRDKHENVIVLHGAGGVVFDGPEMRRVARELANNGYSAFVIHYFDRTNTIFARDGTMQKNFDIWIGTVRDAITWISQRQRSHSVGIFGYSLGGFLSVAAASDNDLVGAVVEQAGGIWNNEGSRIGRLRSLLIIHGTADQRVPFDKYCGYLQRTLEKRGTKFEKRIFPTEGHRFSADALAQVRRETVHFFNCKLPARDGCQ